MGVRENNGFSFSSYAPPFLLAERGGAQPQVTKKRKGNCTGAMCGEQAVEPDECPGNILGNYPEISGAVPKNPEIETSRERDRGQSQEKSCRKGKAKSKNPHSTGLRRVKDHKRIRPKEVMCYGGWPQRKSLEKRNFP